MHGRRTESVGRGAAGVLHELIDLLLAKGARLAAPGAGNGHALVNGCLANGRPEGAEHLAQRGAPLDLEGAAGVGRLDVVKQLLATSSASQMNDGFGWACTYGRTGVVEYLLDHGVDINELTRPHKQTGLHGAAVSGNIETVKALLKRGPKLDIREGSFDSTPLGWALYGWWERRQEPARQEPFYDIVGLLVAAGAPIEASWLTGDNAIMDPRMRSLLRRSA